MDLSETSLPVVAFTDNKASEVTPGTLDAEKWKSDAASEISAAPSSRREAILTLLGGWMVLFVTYGYTTAFGVFQDHYTRSDAAMSASASSWIGSTQLFLLDVGGLLGGWLLDRGYFRVTNFGGSLIYVTMIFLLSAVDTRQYWQLLLVQGIGMGIGAGLIMTPSLAILAEHWPHRPALAMGLAVTGSPSGGVVLPIMLNILIGKVGFAWAVRAFGFLSLAMLAVANAIMTPAKRGAGKSEPSRRRPSVWNILGDAPFILVAVAMILIQLGLLFPYFYLQSFAVDHGVDKHFAFYIIAILNAGGLASRIGPALIADRLGPVNVTTVATGLSGLLLFALSRATNAASVAGFAVVYGLTSGTYLSSITPALAAFSVDSSEVGTRLGIAFFVASFGGLVGTPLDGALLGHQSRWENPILFSSLVCLGGTALLFIARFIQARRKGTAWV